MKNFLTKISNRYFLLLCLIISLFSVKLSVQAQDKPVDPAVNRFGFIDVNAYYDTRDATTLSINYLAVFNHGLSYFSFINYDQSFFEAQDKADFAGIYSEHNLTYSPFKKLPIDFNVQFVIMSGEKNDKIRFAPSWRVSSTPGISEFFKKIGLSWGINFHVLQLQSKDDPDDMTFQMEHFYRWNILPEKLNNRVYISGFADHTLAGKNAKGLVTEHQLGIRLVDSFYAVAEYRHFSYFPKGYQNGVGFGLEYEIMFK